MTNEQKIKKELIKASPGNIESFNKMIKNMEYPIVLYSIIFHHTEKEDEIVMSDSVSSLLEDNKIVRKDVIEMLKNIISKLENQTKDEIIRDVSDTSNSSATTCKEIPIFN